MENLSDVFTQWRLSLLRFHDWFEELRYTTRYFHPKTFLFFVVLNLACFWWALLTAYPDLLTGPGADEYSLMGFPVAILGALFDSLSLLATIYIFCTLAPSHVASQVSGSQSLRPRITLKNGISQEAKKVAM